MYYKLENFELEKIKKVQKVIPIKHELYGDFINIDTLFEMLFDLYDEYINFIKYCEDVK